ncbi:hypothetical protein [Vagococcus fluvialis]|uniref:hypothetical protein n=1 Tax=Vagococcus fluvialis TaxID=2738 RepID=UPI003B5BA120
MNKIKIVLIGLFFILLNPINLLAETSFQTVDSYSDFSVEEEQQQLEQKEESTESMSSDVEEIDSQTIEGSSNKIDLSKPWVEVLGNEPYLVEYAPRNPQPSGLERLSYIDVRQNDYGHLKELLETSGPAKIRLSSDITFPTGSSASKITVKNGSNKELDLNGKTLYAGSVGQIIVNTKYFKMKNGTIIGGYESSIPTKTQSGGFVYSDNRTSNEDNSLVFEGITHKGNNTDSKTGNTDRAAGGFVAAPAGDIFFIGDNTLLNGNFNVKGGNVTFLDGNFKGEVFYSGISNSSWAATGTGAVNLAFPMYGSYNHRRQKQADQFNGNRRILVEKDAKVELRNNQPNRNDYHNVIGNWSVLTVTGSLKMYAINPVMRTISSEVNNAGGYAKNDAQTHNGQANIYVNEGATFLGETRDLGDGKGMIYTYNTNLYAYKPNVFDLRYFGEGPFFFSWKHKQPLSNMYLKEMDIGVWDKSSKGIGNPRTIWQDVQELNVEKFTQDFQGNVTPASMNSFKQNEYSRISNDVTLPKLIPDEKFKLPNTNNYQVRNGEPTFYGTTDYFYPDGKLVGRPAIDAKVELKRGTQVVATTTTDFKGEWKFQNFKGLKLPAGNYAVKLTDKDQRYSDDIPLKIVDTLPPEATTKLFKIKKNTPNGLMNPLRDSILTYKDETSPNSEISFEYLSLDSENPVPLSEQERNEILSVAGYYEIPLRVKDKAGNPIIVDAPVIVYNEIVPTNYFASGVDFTYDYDKWISASENEKKEIVKDANYGNARGYHISGNVVTDITNDSNQFTINIFNPSGGWKPDQPYVIGITAGGIYPAQLSVTLVRSEVKMSIKQVYKGNHQEKIYSKIDPEERIDNSLNIYNVKVGDSIQPIIENLEKNYPTEIKLDFDWYKKIDLSKFVVKVNGVVQPITNVPNENFELIFEYEGKTSLNIFDLDYDKVKITDVNDKREDLKTKKDIEIIDTRLKSDWQLKVALADEIRGGQRNELFIGGLLVEKSNGKVDVIDEDGIIYSLKSSSDKKMKTKLPMNVKLYQDIGNSLGKYEGQILWSLEEVP